MMTPQLVMIPPVRTMASSQKTRMSDLHVCTVSPQPWSVTSAPDSPLVRAGSGDEQRLSDAILRAIDYFLASGFDVDIRIGHCLVRMNGNRHRGQIAIDVRVVADDEGQVENVPVR